MAHSLGYSDGYHRGLCKEDIFMEEFVRPIASQLQLKEFQVANTLELLEEKNTVPFITRYRKERTGGLSEDQICQIQELHQYQINLRDRKETILEQIRQQEKLTPELEQKILATDKLKTLEDLYLPFKPKKRTLATMARERGLGDLADQIWNNKASKEEFSQQSKKLVGSHEELSDLDNVVLGLQHILAECISEKSEIRQKLRDYYQKEGRLQSLPTKSEKEKDAESPYYNYFEFDQPVSKVPPHRILALNRGEKEKSLKVSISVNQDILNRVVAQDFRIPATGELNELWKKSIEDSIERLLHPSIEREVRRELTEVAEEHAIEVFAQNLRQLLLTPPLAGKKILGIDPGFRTGCKLAAIDEYGKLLEVGVIFPHPPQKQTEKSRQIVLEQIKKHKVSLIAIGNGTAHRETEEFISELISSAKLNLSYMIVNEAGASVYSASKEAQSEFPDLDASYRGTVSIARRIQDPLAEIVKIDPKSIGVGLYQHDVNQKKLSSMLDRVVESCVNYVGVDLNTASVSLLKYVSGLNEQRAKKIYNWRIEHGKFSNRKSVLDVKGIGKETFVQAAGFLKITDGDNPLDHTQIHPESYEQSRKLLKKIHIPLDELKSSSSRSKVQQSLENLSVTDLAKELEVGEPTLQDIIENLKKPGRDPRDDFPKPLLRKEILSLEDLEEGTELEGTVRNVVDFGAFVDIGIKEDGLVHISEMADCFVRNPQEICSVGDIVQVWVKSIDKKRRRIALSMKSKG